MGRSASGLVAKTTGYPRRALMARLLVLNPSEVSRDPRARRQLLAAHEQGWEPVGLCGQLSRLPPLPLAGIEVHRVGEARAVRRPPLITGIRARQRRIERELRGLVRLARFARLTLGLVRAGVRLGPFDVVHANELETLPAATALAKRWRARLVYDAHEVYASSEPDYPAIYSAVTVPLEAWLARRADAVTTVSEPIAHELERRLRLPRVPTAILNCPPIVEVPAPQMGEGPLRVVYQGAMGSSRPLDDILTAAEAAPSVAVTIRVAGANIEALQADATLRGLSNRVTAVPPVEPTALVDALVGEEVGLVINRPLSRNDELVFPNKLFEYLMAGLAVVVPRMPGIAPWVEEQGVGAVYEAARPESLGAVLEELAHNRDRVLALRRRARELALLRFNATVQSEALERVWTADGARPSRVAAASWQSKSGPNGRGG